MQKSEKKLKMSSQWVIANRFKWSLLSVVVLLFLGCSATQPVPYEEMTVAVWDLEDLTPGGSMYPDFGQPLAAKIIETIRDTKNYTVVERERLLLALEELNVGSSALANESTRLEIGKILQARFMVFGGYQVIGTFVRLDLRLVDVETGRILNAGHKTTWASNLTGWLKAVEELAVELI